MCNFFVEITYFILKYCYTFQKSARGENVKKLRQKDMTYLIFSKTSHNIIPKLFSILFLFSFSFFVCLYLGGEAEGMSVCHSFMQEVSPHENNYALFFARTD